MTKSDFIPSELLRELEEIYDSIQTPISGARIVSENETIENDEDPFMKIEPVIIKTKEQIYRENVAQYLKNRDDKNDEIQRSRASTILATHNLSQPYTTVEKLEFNSNLSQPYTTVEKLESKQFENENLMILEKQTHERFTAVSNLKKNPEKYDEVSKDKSIQKSDYFKNDLDSLSKNNFEIKLDVLNTSISNNLLEYKMENILHENMENNLDDEFNI